jgi:uroporphyrinogen decarboxylase
MTQRELFLANARGEKTDRTPIWIMRQAGRYLPDYLRVREKYSFEELAKTPEAAAEVTVQPVEIFGLDAAIIFSDILFILEPLGIDLKYNPGPHIHPILQSPEQVDHYRDFDVEDKLGFVADVLRTTRGRIGSDVAMLGFCGAPFTLFCYLCGLEKSKDFDKAYTFLLRYPQAGAKVLDLLTSLSIRYLRMQIAAGADAVQIFDTWAGDLSEAEYRQWAFPYTQRIVVALKKNGSTVSLYIRNSYHLLDSVEELNVDIFSVDWKTPMTYAKEKLPLKTLQGNLNPYLMLGSKETVIEHASAILESMADYPGYIFNLGHGILPQTPVENVRALVETVHGYERVLA